MRIPVKHIPEDIMQQYKLKSLVVNSFAIVEIQRDMYALPKASIIANNQSKTLSEIILFPCPTIPSLYKYKIFNTMFT